MSKPRKKYKPKYVAMNPMSTFFGGMSDQHSDHLATLNTRNHMALARLAQGTGTRNDWDMVVGAINISNVLCEQGFGDEYRQDTIAARDALLQMGMRGAKSNRFVFKGDELKAVNKGMDAHDAQLVNIRSIDVDRAADEVIRRVKHRINSTSVWRELSKEAA